MKTLVAGQVLITRSYRHPVNRRRDRWGAHTWLGSGTDNYVMPAASGTCYMMQLFMLSDGKDYYYWTGVRGSFDYCQHYLDFLNSPPWSGWSNHGYGEFYNSVFWSTTRDKVPNDSIFDWLAAH